MAHLPFAFSVSHFINSVGADAGFASIIGLAILVLLYFAQARETSTLRERADDAEQRAGALEARLAQVSRAQSAQPRPGVAQRPAAARPLVNPPPGTVTAARGAGTVAAGAPAQAGAGTAAGATAVALPSAPAGVGGPALSSATHLIPLPAVAASSVETPGEVPAEVPGSPSPESTQPPAGAPRPATAAAQATAVPSPTATPSPVAAGATAVFSGGNGPGTPGPGAPGPGAPTAGTNGIADHAEDEYYSDEFTAVATQEPEQEPLPRVQLRPGGSGPVRPAQTSARRSSSPRGPSRLGRGFAVLLGVLMVAAVAAVLLVVTSSGGGKTASTGSTPTTNTPTAHHRAKAKAFVPSTVSVGVLNGTAQAGLAAKVMSQLAAVGYKQGITPANAANQTQATTVVAYLPGRRAAALQVAKSLKLSSSTVQPIDSQTQLLACPQASSCAVGVVVTVGQDLAGG